MKPCIRRSLHGSDGKGMIGCVISIVLIGIAIYASIKLVPVYYANYALESYVKGEASRAGAHYLEDAAIINSILDAAKKNDIELGKKNVTVRRFAGQMFIEVNYAVPVDFEVFKHNLNFQIKASSLIGSL
jgi:hypothetical protein